MDIKFLNADTLHIKTKEVSILLDPTTQEVKSTKADIAITTTDNNDLTTAEILKFDWPGEYEAKNVLVKSIATSNKDKKEVRIVTMEIDGINTAYVSQIDQIPSNKKLFEELSIVEVLILNTNLTAKQMMDLIEEVEPKCVVLAANESNTDENGVSEFEKLRKEIGKTEQEIEEKVTIKIDMDALDSQIDYFFVSV